MKKNTFNMKIANIVYSGELVNHNRCGYVNYISEMVSYDKIENSDLPVLYVGWNEMKKLNSNSSEFRNISILDKKVSIGKIYWEFSFDENKSSHVNGVNMFCRLAPQFYFNCNYDYVDLDPIFKNLYVNADILNKIPEKIDFIYKYKNEIIYILSKNQIYGINIDAYDYFGFNVEFVLNELLKRSEKHFFDVHGVEYNKQLKIFQDYPYLKRFMCVIMKNEEIIYPF